MSRITIILSIFLMLFSVMAESNLKTGLKIRNRSSISTIGGSNYSKEQVYTRYSDIRFRPSFDYTANDKLSANLLLQIGDFCFGDEKNGFKIGNRPSVTVKAMSVSVSPIKEHKFTLGQSFFKDAHSLIIDDALPGLKYEGNVDRFKFLAGYFVGLDNKELKIDSSSTYSFGNSIIMVNPGYKFENNNIAADLLFLTQFGNEEPVINNDTNIVISKTFNFWIAPHFTAKFGNFNGDAQFIFNNNSFSYDRIKGGQTFNDSIAESKSGTGIAFSLKTDFKTTDKLTIGLNFLYASGDEVADLKAKNGYRNLSGASFYDNGTLVLSQSGLEGGKNTLGSLLLNNNPYGIILPVFTIKYEISPLYLIGANFAMVNTVEEVLYDAQNNKSDNNFGMEFGFSGCIKSIENLTIAPFAAIFVPGNAYNGINDVEIKDKTDLQTKFGIAVNASL